jgi:hypothetical protein
VNEQTNTTTPPEKWQELLNRERLKAPWNWEDWQSILLARALDPTPYALPQTEEEARQLALTLFAECELADRAEWIWNLARVE